MCMRRRGQSELLPFDPELERTLNQLRREQREAHQRNLAIMQNQEGQDQGQEQNEPQGGQNENNGMNYAPRPFIQPDDSFMLLEEFALLPTVVQSTIQRPPIKANNFELKTITLQMLQNIKFHGLPSENPNAHLTNFIEVCDTVKYNGVIEETLRLRLFPLSLGDRAKHWLTSQPLDSITSWNVLVQKFLTKFFSPLKIAQLLQEINTFRQLDALRRCPHHRLTRWTQVHTFYNSLSDSTITVIDASVGAALMKRTTNQAYGILEDMATNSN